MNNQKVVMMGLGYIGLPTAALIASRGIAVHGVDINVSTVEKIKKGEIHIVEPDLGGLVKYVVEKGDLKVDTKPIEADVFIIAVPTPFKGNHEPDVSYIENAIRTITPFINENNLIIIESTSPVGTTEGMLSIIVEERAELKNRFNIAYCPERVLPGKILYELEHNDRAIGGIDEKSAEKAVEFYSQFVKGTLYKTNARTAEMCKLVENSFRDVNIAFANELSILCDRLSINVWELIDLANKHPRVNILQPGPGVGGHCIAVDPWFIVHSLPDDARLIKTAREINDNKPHYVLKKIIDKAEKFKNPVIACLGLSFKPDIDDIRESPALNIVEELLKYNPGTLLVVEPHIKELPQTLKSRHNISLVDYSSALSQADIIAVLVNHRQFYNIDRNLVKEKVIIDTRGIW
jgi:UDP-N-acetyl-D-mannosaminuronic acid dehydrogenase